MPNTIRDVAKLAGVAPSTVSAVINDKGYVHPETRNRVLDAIQKLDYTPRRSARDLARQTSGNVGFIVAESHFTRAEPFYTRVFMGSEFEARNHDLYVLLTTITREYRNNTQFPRFLKESNVDGVLLIGRLPRKFIEDVMNKDIPAVLVDYDLNRKYCSKILIDNKYGVSLAIRHLVELGHKKIGFVGGEPDHPSVAERFQGFLQGLNKNGLAICDEWISMSGDELSPQVGSRAMHSIWKSTEHPTALICANDATAMGVMNVAREKGISIPKDLSIIGFDDVATCTLLDPPLTTIRVNKEDLGAIAMRTLVEEIQKKQGNNRTIREGVELIIRQSTGRPSV